jgi:hypothetical protein
MGSVVIQVIFNEIFYYAFFFKLSSCFLRMLSKPPSFALSLTLYSITSKQSRNISGLTLKNMMIDYHLLLDLFILNLKQRTKAH